MLGDCILHLDHHEMERECWVPVIQHYQATVEAHPGDDVDVEALRVVSVRGYKAAYERALLDAMTTRTENQ